jgi:branched-chain amino acid transport system permease protein
MSIFIVDAMNGISYGLLLFMLSSGLTLIFSFLGVLNVAHASFYMLGAYVGAAIGAHWSFWVAIVAAPAIVGAAGALVERLALRHVRGQGALHELLLTFGLAYLLGEAVKFIWGPGTLAAPVPAVLDAPLFVFDSAAFPRYRAFVMATALVMLALLYAVLHLSRTGLVLRAALGARQAVEALGHDVPRIGTLVFALGTGLAALAGVVGAPLFVVEPGMAESMGSIVFVVVIVGGLGSIGGALAASLLIGCLQTFAAASPWRLAALADAAGLALPSRWGALTLAQLAPLVPYLLLVAMLVCRPRGIAGTRGDAA